MLTFKERQELLNQIETVELIEDEDPATTTQGIDFTPTQSTFAGHPCLDVDDKTYHNMVQGKVPFARWIKYVDDDQMRTQLKKLYYRNKRVLVRNNQTQQMVYVK